mmetsp:Transcript_744/g.877  ORF Transcript_744/g.877 Transcript_744/m.877 type:complete len:207 (-) Transcript_744:670-1290(-)
MSYRRGHTRHNHRHIHLDHSVYLHSLVYKRKLRGCTHLGLYNHRKCLRNRHDHTLSWCNLADMFLVRIYCQYKILPKVSDTGKYHHIHHPGHMSMSNAVRKYICLLRCTHLESYKYRIHHHSRRHRMFYQHIEVSKYTCYHYNGSYQGKRHKCYHSHRDHKPCLHNEIDMFDCLVAQFRKFHQTIHCHIHKSGQSYIIREHMDSCM